MKRELDKSEKYATGRIRMKSTGGNKLRELFFIRRDDLTDKKWQLDIGIDEREVHRDVRDGDRVEFTVMHSSSSRYPFTGIKCRRYVERRRSSPEKKRPKKDVKDRLGTAPVADKAVKISVKSYRIFVIKLKGSNKNQLKIVSNKMRSVFRIDESSVFWNSFLGKQHTFM